MQGILLMNLSMLDQEQQSTKSRWVVTGIIYKQKRNKDHELDLHHDSL